MKELNKDEEKEILLYSESFPLNENKERKKVKPVSKVHELLSGVKIDLNKIYYKPLGPEHLEEVKNLHKEWFPVPYDEHIFTDALINNRGYYLTQGAFYFLEEENKEVILGLILCLWRYVDKYCYESVGDKVIEEISKSIDYEEEAQFFLSKQPYYSMLYIMSLGVIDECRKMNIGTNLIKDVINYVATFPFCKGVYLNVIADNFSGKKFYEKNGMTCYNTLKKFYLIEDKRYDSDIYVKIFDKKVKDKIKAYQNSFMNWKQKCYKFLVLKPFYFLVKLFLLICLCRCFKKKIKFD